MDNTLHIDKQNVVDRDLSYIIECLHNEFKSLAGKRLLITGGGGFLGYYLTQTITHWNRHHDECEAIHLTVYDNYSRGNPAWLQALGEQKKVDLVPHDVRQPLPKNLQDFHYIIHAASIASPTYYRIHPIETMDANVNGLRHLLEYSLERKNQTKQVEGFLFFSTSEIYGNPSSKDVPTPETYCGLVSCTGPRACYDESKRYGETMCVNFTKQYALPIKTARPFNNYGPGIKLTDKRVLPDFARDVLSDQEIVLLSDGSPTRTFCYVADAVIGYYKILVNGRPGEAYNIGVQTPEISMRELAERVAKAGRELFGYTGRVIHKPSDDKAYLIDNPERRCPIITKAREEIGYNPSISLDDGIRRLLRWYHDHPDGKML
jgi:UDP-glucuronate decarboxylase